MLRVRASGCLYFVAHVVAKDLTWLVVTVVCGDPWPSYLSSRGVRVSDSGVNVPVSLFVLSGVGLSWSVDFSRLAVVA